MSAVSEVTAQIENELTALDERVKAKIEDAEKKVADVPTAEELARLAAIPEKIKGMAV